MDIIRCSVTFRDITDLLDGYNYFLSKINEHKGILKVARVKNGFNKESDGYRDLKINIVYKSSKQGLSMIGEIQFLLLPFLRSKKKSHKLYAILRRQTYYELIIGYNGAINGGDNKKKNGVGLTLQCEILSSKQFVYNVCVCEDLNLAAILTNTQNDKRIKIEFINIKNGEKLSGDKYNIDSTHTFDDILFFYKYDKRISAISRDLDESGWALLYTQRRSKTQSTKIFFWTPKRGSTSGITSSGSKNKPKNVLIENESAIESFVIDKFDRLVIMCSSIFGTEMRIGSMDDLKISDWCSRTSNLSKSTTASVEVIELDMIQSPIPPTIDYSAKKYLCFVSNMNNQFWLVDSNKKTKDRLSSSKVEKVQSCVFVGNNYLIIGGTAKFTKRGIIELWDKKTKKALRVIKTNLTSGICVLLYVGILIYGVSFDGDLIVLDTQDNFNCKKLDVKLYYNPKINMSTNSKYLAVAGQGCKIFNM